MTHRSYKVIFLVVIGVVSTTGIIYSNHQIDNYHNDKISRLDHCPEPKLVSKINDKTKVILIGDSRIWEWSKYWTFEHSATINRGMPGATSMEVICQNADLKLIQDKLLIIHSGINDAVAISMLDSESEQHSQALKSAKNTANFINMLSTNNTVLFLTIAPPIDTDPLRKLVWGSGIDQTVENISDIIVEELTESVKILDARSIFYNAKDQEWDSELSRDALHWNQKGYQLLNKELAHLVQ